MSASTPSESLASLHQSTEANQILLANEVFETGQKLRSQCDKLILKAKLSRRELIELHALNGELRSELNITRKSLSDLQVSTEITTYKLSEAEKSLENLRAKGLPNPELASEASYRSEIFRIEEKFTGTDKSLYPSFRRQICLALTRNADRYTTLQSQISLIYQHLGLGPKAFLERYLSNDGEFDFASLEEVWGVLDVSYKNPNEEEEAREGLSYLRQGNRPFGTYLAEFQRLQNLSDISDNKTLISYLRNGVSKEMRSCIGHHQDIHKKYTFDEFVALCKDFVIRLDLERPSYLLNRKPVRLSPNLPPTIRAPLASGANNIPLGDPMDLDRADLYHIGPDGRLTAEERQRRKTLGLCMRCGKDEMWQGRSPGLDLPKKNRQNKILNRIEIEVKEKDDSLYENLNA